MLRLAVCKNSANNDTPANMEKTVSEQLNATAYLFQNGVNLAKAINKGESFDFFLLDNPAMEEFMAAKTLHTERFFMLSTQEREVKLPYSSIICVEHYDRVMTFHAEGLEPLVSRPIRAKFETAIAPLLTDGRFLHVRKSFVINMAKVDCIMGKIFRMSSGLEIVLPRYSAAEVKKQYLNYLAGIGVCE